MHYLRPASLPRSPSASSVTPKTSSMRHRSLPRIETEWDMATIVIASPVAEKHGIRVREHLFFGTMTVVIALVVFIGFARTYYLAGVFNAKPLAAPIVHLHGAVFTSWIVLLLTQSLLVGTGHTRIHRRLGIIGLVLAPLLVVFGVLVAVEMVKRFAPITTVDSPGIFAVALSEITGFAVPAFFAFRLRRDPATHKRLILIATIAMTTAGFGRWPVALLLHRPFPAMLAAFSLLGLIFAFDLASLRRIHRATMLGSAWVVFVELSAVAIGQTAAWHAFAVHV